jgi:hypothetical protein
VNGRGILGVLVNGQLVGSHQLGIGMASRAEARDIGPVHLRSGVARGESTVGFVAVAASRRVLIAPGKEQSMLATRLLCRSFHPRR